MLSYQFSLVKLIIIKNIKRSTPIPRGANKADKKYKNILKLTCSVSLRLLVVMLICKPHKVVLLSKNLSHIIVSLSTVYRITQERTHEQEVLN